MNSKEQNVERKNLVTCKPTEFLRQTNRIRKSAEKWMKATGVLEIRKRKPEGLRTIHKDMPEEEMVEAKKHNAKLIAEQSQANLHDMVVAAMEDHPDETLELLALACFVEPEHIDDHRVSYYLANLSDILADEDVLSFFTSLVQLEQTGILKA